MQLRSLQSNPAFKQFESVLGKLFETNALPLFRTLDPQQIAYQQGVCNALEKVLTLIADLDQKAREIDEHASTARERKPEHSNELVYANTPFWDEHRKRATIYGPG